MSSIRIDGGFDDAVGAVGEEGVGVLNAAERVSAGYQMGGVNLSFRNQLHDCLGRISAFVEIVAFVNGKLQFYNQSTAKTYEVQTGAPTSDETEWIDQLFSLYDVFRIEPDATNPDEPLVLALVLITDCTCEI